MKEYLAYIDESGDPNFGPKSTKFFFMAGVVFEKQKLPHLLVKLDEVGRKHDAKKLKSSKISDFGKRKGICEEFAQLDLRIISLWVDKAKLSGEWFRNRPTFYKFIQKRLNHEIYRLFSNVQVTLHRYGSSQYQSSLRQSKINGS